MQIDPFSLKSKSKLSPERLAFTARARANDYLAMLRFNTYAISACILPELPAPPVDTAWSDTAVTREQLQHLLMALAATEELGGAVVEIGSYRGVTAAALASSTARTVVAVDPFLGGYGATNMDYDTFKRRIQGIANLVHVRSTSGAAAAGWNHGPASLIFIDAVHDYANVSFDISVWWPKLIVGGIMAFHDTDDANFPGTRRAVHELFARGAELYAHPHNITLLRKLAHNDRLKCETMGADRA